MPLSVDMWCIADSTLTALITCLNTYTGLIKGHRQRRRRAARPTNTLNTEHDLLHLNNSQVSSRVTDRGASLQQNINVSTDTEHKLITHATLTGLIEGHRQRRRRAAGQLAAQRRRRQRNRADCEVCLLRVILLILW